MIVMGTLPVVGADNKQALSLHRKCIYHLNTNAAILQHATELQAITTASVKDEVNSVSRSIRQAATPICPLAPYTNINLQRTMGVWYVHKIMAHSESTRHRDPHICPVINLSLDIRNVTFIMDNKEDPPQRFNLFINNFNEPSIWSYRSDSASTIQRTVQVTTFDSNDDHIVLTMCKSQQFLTSIIASRKDSADKKITDAIATLLQKRGLHFTNTYDRCIKE